MKNFNYYAPTRVVFGIGAETQTGALIRAQGGTRVLVHYGTHFAQESGLLDRVCASLREAELPYVLLGGVVPRWWGGAGRNGKMAETFPLEAFEKAPADAAEVEWTEGTIKLTIKR